MRLARLAVSNHSRLVDGNIAVRDHLVLIGANDVGKSSLLRCLDLLLGASTAQLYARLSIDDVRDPSLPMVVEASLVHLTADELLHFTDAVTVDPAGGPQTLTVRLEVDASDEENLVIRRPMADGMGRQLSREQIDQIGWRMVGATQVGARDFRDGRSSALDDILASIDLGADRGSLEALAKQFEDQLGSSGALTGLRGQLATQLSKATPTVLKPDDLAFTTGAQADQDLLSDVRLQIVRDGTPRDLTQQSDGARAMFAIALYDLVAEAANIVAIDEPEIHLHPTSQRSMARLLREGVNQKVIATHSADIVGRFDPEQVAVVRPGGQIVQPQAGFLARHQKLVAQWWVQDKLEPLTARHVVIVEGPSDRIILLRAAKLLGFDLDRAGISVLELGGAASISSILVLFGNSGFQVPLTVLIDEDARDATAQTMGIPPWDLESGAPYPVFVSAKDLEDEYVRALTPAAVSAALQASDLWRHGQLQPLRDAGAGPEHAVVSAFCRNKRNKVLASIAVADMLSTTSAPGIDSIRRLIESLHVDD